MQTVARTVTEATVGDLLWYFDPNVSVRKDGEYLGRGGWKLVEVQKVGRQSVETGDKDWPRGWYKFARDSGSLRARNGYGYSHFVCGYAEREVRWWQAEALRLAERVRKSDDIEILKSVAHLLGVEGPPDFSKAPEPASTQVP